MKTFKIFLLAAVAAAFASSCETVDVTAEPSSDKVQMTFTVSDDESADTKTFLASNGQSVRWKKTVRWSIRQFFPMMVYFRLRIRHHHS